MSGQICPFPTVVVAPPTAPTSVIRSFARQLGGFTASASAATWAAGNFDMVCPGIGGADWTLAMTNSVQATGKVV